MKNYQEIINSKQFEDVVRIAAKTVDVQKWIELSMPPQFGFLQLDWNHSDNAKWKKLGDQSPPIFEELFGAGSKARLLDDILWEALKEGNGDADKVWTCFKENLIGYFEGLSTIDTGISVRIGGKKGHEGKYGTAEQKCQHWQEWQDYIDSEHKLHPNFNFAMLQAHAAEHFRVSKKTIWRHVRNPLQ